MTKLIQKKTIIASLSLLLGAGIVMLQVTGCGSTRETSGSSEDPVDNAAQYLTRDLSSEISNRGLSKIAVVEFEFSKKHGSYLQRKLVDRLTLKFIELKYTKRGNPEVLGQGPINKALSELKVSGPELRRLPVEMREFGARTKVDAILFGNIEDSRDKLIISCDLISVLNGSVISSSGIAIEKNASILQ